MTHPEILWAERTGYPSWMQGEEEPEPLEVSDVKEFLLRKLRTKPQVLWEFVEFIEDTDDKLLLDFAEWYGEEYIRE